MYAYKSRINITNKRKLEIDLPIDIPEGEAEVIVLTENNPVINNSADSSLEKLNRLDEWINRIPQVPAVPLSSIDRGELYK